MESLQSLTFLRHKYGRELLIDAFSFSDDLLFGSPRSYRLRYYDVVFISKAQGEVLIDNHHFPLSHGQILLTAPGQVRQWHLQTPMSATVLLFPAEFLEEQCGDPLFLQRLSSFHSKDRQESLLLPRNSFDEFLADAKELCNEVADLREDSVHLLKAGLLRLLVHLNRAYLQTYPQGQQSRSDNLFVRFRTMLDEKYAALQRVSEYARALGVAPRKLNDVCIKEVGVNAAELIRGRIYVEAKRRLTYSDERVTDIAISLGFTDPAYFNRFFRRYAKTTPLKFRQESVAL